MRVDSISNTNFLAGNIKLTGLTKEDLLFNYDKIQDMAKKKKIDFAILKNKDTKYLPHSNMYTVIASKEVNKPPYIMHGTGVSIISKNAEKETLADKILTALEQAVDKLKQKVNI